MFPLRMPRPHVALFTTGYPFVDAATRAVELARRHQAGFSRSVGEPFSLKRDQFVRWFLESDASHALMLEGDVVPPEDALERLLDVGSGVATALYPQWLDDELCTNVQTAGDGIWDRTAAPIRFPVTRCLFGCALVSREAFNATKAPWFLGTMTANGFVSDSEWFCGALEQAGVSLVCDGSILCAAYRQGADLNQLTGGRIQRRESRR